MRSALDRVDVIVTSGGVSMGEKVFTLLANMSVLCVNRMIEMYMIMSIVECINKSVTVVIICVFCLIVLVFCHTHTHSSFKT